MVWWPHFYSGVLDSAELGASAASLAVIYFITPQIVVLSVGLQKPMSYINTHRQHCPVVLHRAGRQAWQEGVMEQREV